MNNPIGRKISVAIRHRGVTDLHQANHRHQRAQKPQPANQRVRTAFAPSQTAAEMASKTTAATATAGREMVLGSG